MLKSMLNELHDLEKETFQALNQLELVRQKILEAYGMDEFNEKDIAQIPFAAYEMQLERHLEEKKEIEERHLKEKEQIHERNEREKDKIRKNYKHIIIGISAVLAILILSVFGTVIWFLNTYDILTYAQDSTYGNANFIGNDGDITNGEADYYMGQAEEQTD